ncbi:unnamed protein product [Ceutorhynchus assimilis]|uniref:Uncharacterized protein n=1 Tax=Ceutorhynchus assimilis TaxID=467358 RepID=A0A9N9MJA1_9CUCU|nr:unnamed protein product [Ceutorhynchus assimilis]
MNFESETERNQSNRQIHGNFPPEVPSSNGQTDKPESEKADNQGTSEEEEDMLENQTGYSSDDSIADRDYVPDKEPSDSDGSSDDNIPLLVVKRKIPTESDEMKEQNKRRNANKDQDKQPERKRLVDGPYTRKKRKERTENKNTGQSYVTAKGKEVRKREMKNLPICRTKCRERLVEDVRQGIFNEYWGLGTRDKRVTYIADHSETKETAVKRKRTDDPAKSRNRQVSHSFHFKINGGKVKVCRGCFMKILDETQMFITLALDNSRLSLSGIVQPDKRGRHEPKNKHSRKIIQEAIDHIKSFPAHQSHYTRRTNDKKYLAPYLTLQKMYELYSENRKEKVSRRIYEKEFHKLKLAFKKP